MLHAIDDRRINIPSAVCAVDRVDKQLVGLVRGIRTRAVAKCDVVVAASGDAVPRVVADVGSARVRTACDSERCAVPNRGNARPVLVAVIGLPSDGGVVRPCGRKPAGQPSNPNVVCFLSKKFLL